MSEPQEMTGEQVRDDLMQGVELLRQAVESLPDGDPGHALAHTTWFALRIAEHAQRYAKGVVSDDPDVDAKFLSLDGALFTRTGGLMTLSWSHFEVIREAARCGESEDE